jgi:hypothetical protein
MLLHFTFYVFYRRPTSATAANAVNAEASIRELSDLAAPDPADVDDDVAAASLALATLGVCVILNTLLKILASAKMTLVSKLNRSDWTPEGSVVAHAGVERSVTGGAVAKEYWFVVGKETRFSTLLAREVSSLAGMSKATSRASDVATGPWMRDDSYEARAEEICML